MHYTQIYSLTEKARYKLMHAASHKSMNLRRVLGHALLLDTLVAELSETEVVWSEDNPQNEVFAELESDDYNLQNSCHLTSSSDSDSDSNSDSYSVYGSDHDSDPKSDSDCCSDYSSDCTAGFDLDLDTELDFDWKSDTYCKKLIPFFSRVKFPASRLVDLFINRGVVTLTTVFRTSMGTWEEIARR